VATLMEQGRSRWKTLGELGERFAAVEQELAALAAPPPASTGRASQAQTSGTAPAAAAENECFN